MWFIGINDTVVILKIFYKKEHLIIYLYSCENNPGGMENVWYEVPTVKFEIDFFITPLHVGQNIQKQRFIMIKNIHWLEKKNGF